jgi:hypothetical protein
MGGSREYTRCITLLLKSTVLNNATPNCAKHLTQRGTGLPVQQQAARDKEKCSKSKASCGAQKPCKQLARMNMKLKSNFLRSLASLLANKPRAPACKTT